MIEIDIYYSNTTMIESYNEYSLLVFSFAATTVSTWESPLPNKHISPKQNWITQSYTADQVCIPIEYLQTESKWILWGTTAGKKLMEFHSRGRSLLRLCHMTGTMQTLNSS